MKVTRRQILAGLAVTTAGLALALALGHPLAETVEPVRDAEVAAETPLRSSEPFQPAGHSPDRKPLAAPPTTARKAERGPVLVTGCVVDDRGIGIEGVRIIVFARPHESSKLQSGEEMQRLHEASNLTVERLGEGRFAVRGWTPAQRLSVHASTNVTHEERSCTVGTRGLEIEISRHGRVEAALLHDPGIRAKAFELSLRGGVDAPPSALGLHDTRLPDKCFFRSNWIPVGSYSLEVRLRDHTEPLLRLDGVQVTSDELCTDQRLQLLDTRGLCRRIVVRLTRPNGRSLPLPVCLGAKITALDPNGEPLSTQPRIRQSRIDLITRYPYVDLEIAVRDYRTVHLPLLNASCKVRLEPVE